jgi:hypothetical protein
MDHNHELDQVKQQSKSNAENITSPEVDLSNQATLVPPVFSPTINAPVQRKLNPSEKNSQENGHGVSENVSTDLSYASGGDLPNESTPIQRRTVDEVPEEVGDRQKGPIAVRGRGDNHAFSPNDINQGAIGDCYFLASLAAVAQSNPEHLENAIKDNGDGTYAVTLYVYDDGESCTEDLHPRTVNITAQFPTTPAGNDDANPDPGDIGHAHGGDRSWFGLGRTELWVRLIEKAYAVINGGYANIADGGLVTNALEALTGQDYSYHGSGGRLTESDIITRIGNGEALGTGTRNQASFDALSDELTSFADENDIVAGHAYSVVAADENGITVRNPWGSGASNPTPTMTWAQYRAFFAGYSSPVND